MTTSTLSDLLVHSHTHIHLHLDTKEKVAANHAPQDLAIMSLMGVGDEELKKWYEKYLVLGSGFGSTMPITQNDLVLSLDEQSKYFYAKSFGGSGADWHSWLNFFDSEFERLGFLATVSHYLQQSLLGSSVCGYLLHGLISVGYGLEIKNPNVISEGLAMIAIYHVPTPPLVILPPPSPAYVTPARVLLGDLLSWAKKGESATPIRSFLLSKIPRNFLLCSPSHPQSEERIISTQLLRVASNHESVKWQAYVLMSVAATVLRWGGWKDFVLLHLFTSSIALPALVSALDPPLAIEILSRYWDFFLCAFLAKGAPVPDISLEMEKLATDTPFNPDQLRKLSETIREFHYNETVNHQDEHGEICFTHFE
jgi:hypothetical protein